MTEATAAPTPACAGHTALMYDTTREQTAKQLCRSCELRVRCLARALRHGEPFGIWGGLNPAERRTIETARPDQIPALLRKFAQPKSSRPRAS